jgi:hypothetical protein
MISELLKCASEMRLVARYVPSSPYFRADAPTLATSLAVFEASANFRTFVASRAPQIECLVQGYTAPSNAHALRAALVAQGVDHARIVAVDQLPLPDIYGQLGVAMPEIEFIQADACNLGDCLRGQTFDLVVQDFILNCLPPILAPELLRETRRHIKADGMCLISFSADAQTPVGRTISAASGFAGWPGGWTSWTTGLHHMARSEVEFEEMARRLMGLSVLDDKTGNITHVTDPSGQFEFFSLKQGVIGVIEAAGFAVSIVDASRAVDYNGVKCMRCRVIAKPV